MTVVGDVRDFRLGDAAAPGFGREVLEKERGEKSAPGGYDRHPVPGAVNLGKVVGAEEKVMRPAQREMKEYRNEAGERSYDDGREVEDAVV